MTDADKIEASLTNYRTALADLLRNVPVRDRFREKVVAFCKPEAEADLRKSVPVKKYTDHEGEHTVYEHGGPRRTPLGRLIVEGPKSLDAAYVLLALIHDSGPHVIPVGHAAPDDWWTYSSVNSAPTPLDLFMACEWKGTLQWSMHERTPEAIDKLSGWWKTVEAECAAIGVQRQETQWPDDNAFFERLLNASAPPRLDATEMARLEAYLKRPVRLSTMQRAASGEPQAVRERDRRDRLKEILDFNKALPAQPPPDAHSERANPAKAILRDIQAFERFSVEQAARSWLVQEGETRELLGRLAQWAELMEFDSRPFTNMAELVHDEPRPANQHEVANIAGVIWGEAYGLIRRMKPKATAYAQGLSIPAQSATTDAAPPTQEPKRQKRFAVALSFTGEQRAFVKEVAELLAAKFGPAQVLYDNFHEAEFARPDLDVYLPNLYRTQSELIVLFLCAEYEKKRWCKLEWRYIRQLIATAEQQRIMFLSFDDIGAAPEIGILGGDGYALIGSRTPQEIAGLILQRLQINSRGPGSGPVEEAER